MPIPDLLRALLEAPGPSGDEAPAARVWREAAAGFAEVSSDTLGNSFARVGAGRPALALIGHIDQVGLTITHVDGQGLLAFKVIGGFEPSTAAGQRVTIAGREGPVEGVIASRERSRNERGESALRHEDLHIDIGATSADDAWARVAPGDTGVWHGQPLELPNGRIVSRALDNRLGAYAALEAARRIGKAGDAQVDVVAIASVQEEEGHDGARAAVYELEPLVAIVLDATWATDVPGGDPRRAGKVELGSGAAITRGTIVNPAVFDLLRRTAEEEQIRHAFEVYPGPTYTDADRVHVSRGGVPTALVSIPIRYMHSPSELALLDDLEATIALAVAVARRLTPQTSFLR